MKSSFAWSVSLLLPAVLMLSSCGENKAENPVAAPESPAASPTTAAVPASPAASPKAATGTTTTESATGTKAVKAGTASSGTSCPSDAPIKGKQSDRGKIYHIPKSNNYEQVKPTTCFATVEAAEKAGYRAPKKQ